LGASACAQILPVGMDSITEDGIRRLKEIHGRELDKMVADNVSDLAIAMTKASQAASLKAAEGKLLAAKTAKGQKAAKAAEAAKEAEAAEMKAAKALKAAEALKAAKANAAGAPKVPKAVKAAKAAEDGLERMKADHRSQLDSMVAANVNEHAIASQAAAYGREEREAELRLKAAKGREAPAAKRREAPAAKPAEVVAEAHASRGRGDRAGACCTIS
jgi:hypothetical protein